MNRWAIRCRRGGAPVPLKLPVTRWLGSRIGQRVRRAGRVRGAANRGGSGEAVPAEREVCFTYEIASRWGVAVGSEFSTGNAVQGILRVPVRDRDVGIALIPLPAANIGGESVGQSAGPDLVAESGKCRVIRG